MLPLTDSVIEGRTIVLEKFFALDKEKQTTIINAALQCFAKFGYNKASVNDIAVVADISKASVFQYSEIRRRYMCTCLHIPKRLSQSLFITKNLAKSRIYLTGF